MKLNHVDKVSLWGIRALLVWTIFISVSILATPAFGIAPAWWTIQNAINPFAPKDDFAVVNIGQVKSIARKAAAEMDADFVSGGAGSAIHALIAAWEASPGIGVTRDDYAAVTAGQLKSIAKLFYDRLIELNIRESGSYPWAGNSESEDDYAGVNVGQLKTIFGFAIPNCDTDGDGIGNAWELANGFDPDNPDDAWDDPDGDFLFNVEEFQMNYDPHDALSGFAGLVMIRSQNPLTGIWETREAQNDYEGAKGTVIPPGLIRGGGSEEDHEYDDDWDGDGETNLAEATASPPTDPRLPYDGDGDGLPDRWETVWGLDSESADENTNSISDGLDDFDSDGLTNFQELAAGTDPLDADTDGDTLEDAWEVANSLDPKSGTGVNGASGDFDGDGDTNEEEKVTGAKPNSTYSTAANPGGTAPAPNPVNPPFTLTWNAPEVKLHWYRTTDSNNDVSFANANIDHFPSRTSTSQTDNFYAGENEDIPAVGELIPQCKFPLLSNVNSTSSELGLLIHNTFEVTATGITGGGLDVTKFWNLRRARIKSSTPLPQGFSISCIRIKSVSGVEEVLGVYDFKIPKGSAISDSFPASLSNKLFSPPDGDTPADITYYLLPADLILDNENRPYLPGTEALGVSNYVTTDGLPKDSQFNDTCSDSENFRLKARLPNSTATSVQVKLEVIRSISTVVTHNYTLDKKDGNFVCGKFLRLVSDKVDDAASGVGMSSDPDHQTILVKLGDKIKVSYDLGTGKVQQEIQVGRSLIEDNNASDSPKQHDIREVKVRIVAVKDQAGKACITDAKVNELVNYANERFAQAGIRLNRTQSTIEVIDPPSKPSAENIPAYTYDQEYQDGNYTGNPSYPSEDEVAFSLSKDGDPDTIDIFFVKHFKHTVPARGIAYWSAKNTTGNGALSNFVVISAEDVFPFTLPHEIMHVLLNTGHRNLEPLDALFYSPTSEFNMVVAQKRIGPYPQSTTNNVGDDDTTTLRANCETLP